MQVSQLSRYQLGRLRSLFKSLDIPDPQTLGGNYRGSFVGPGWVGVLVKPALLLTGLGGWWGKIVYEDGRVINIVLRKGKYLPRFGMRFTKERSHIDGRPGLALQYEKDNPILWLFIVDEIRRLDGSTLLGMTRPTIPGLRWLAFPFVLKKVD